MTAVDQSAARWGVELAGHTSDLLDWAEALQLPWDPWVEKVDGDPPVYVLHADVFEECETAGAVHELAEVLVPRINGAMALAKNSNGVKCGPIVELSADARSQQRHYFLNIVEGVTARASLGVMVASVDGVPVNPPPPAETVTQQWLAASLAAIAHDLTVTERADLLAELLVCAGRTDNWFDIYKTMELAEKLAGGEDAMKERLGVEGPAYKAARRTANHHRHANTGGYPLPPEPPTLGAARGLAFRAAREVLRQV